MSESFDLRQRIVDSFPGLIDGRCLLFKKVAIAAGLDFTPVAMTAFSENPKVFEFKLPFDETDLSTFHVQVKQMNIGKKEIISTDI